MLEKFPWIKEDRPFFGRPQTDYDFEARDPATAQKRLKALQEEQASLSKKVGLGDAARHGHGECYGVVAPAACGCCILLLPSKEITCISVCANIFVVIRIVLVFTLLTKWCLHFRTQWCVRDKWFD